MPVCLTLGWAAGFALIFGVLSDAWVPAGRRSGGVVMWAYERAAYITER